MADPKKRVYESTTLGLPPLRMVLVHARNEAQNAAQRPILQAAPPEPAKDETPLDRERAVRRIIQHLEEIED
jgi:hypothetical protein